MTATAMILGMLPMALGLGEGGEQNAPLGRAVIGGLLARPSPRCSSSRSSIRICERSLPQIRSGAWRRKRTKQLAAVPSLG